MGYASRTGTRRNLLALRRAGWRLVLSPTGVLDAEGFRYGLDNGAWTAFQQREPWNAEAFYRAAFQFGPTADWVVAPDVVAGGLASLDLTLQWLPRLDFCPLRLIAVQDGMSAGDVAPHLGPGVGIFVGGSTGWKERSARGWGDLAARVGCYLHVGRVNTRRRIALCADAGADSFDGTSASTYASTLPLLDRARKQLALGGAR